jgi:auxin responsive GH3 family protein
LTAEARAELTARLKPDPERATALRKAFAEGVDFVSRVWPAISYVSTVITGSFAAHLPHLKQYLADLPIYTTVYGASETPIGLNIQIDQPEQYVLLVGLAYFEFIPLEATEKEQPQSRGLDELTVGHYYEPVITNWAGLYRYRLGDIVRVEGYHHQAPILSFSHRIGTLLDLAAEKVSESQVFQALQAALHAHMGEGNVLIDYTTYPRVTSTPPRYEFYLELSREGIDQSLLEKQIDEALCNANAIYASVRKGNVLVGPPVVKCLVAGSFEALTKAREEEAPHIGRNQLKTPRVLANDKRLAFLEGRVISRPNKESTTMGL